MGLYYLRSRYYDPEICRFINADSFASTGQGIIGYNMFAYCNNGPVNKEDQEGLLCEATAFRPENRTADLWIHGLTLSFFIRSCFKAAKICSSDTDPTVF